ncbi:mitochondrial outer membrane import complex protein METAXIN isoform X1 [Nicotiana tomentosiformis]|uniref:mitochondrial outer membrane import complex protein METAXIN isoform X1 n=1 Tax=Nicotiana tomentosiformis TaxID=4098 RepID=UPI00051BA068|nr:mitochondrial outer membrane import complex protein METAXIN [Nicotiana tomentosiformis]
MEEAKEREKLTLVTRKSCFGLPTSCPNCLPVYLYLKFSKTPFDLAFNLINPDSDQIPYVESGTYVAYNNEKGGVIRSLIEDGFVDLDSQVRGIPEWISAKAMVDSWLADAIMYELWVGSDGSSACKIYYSDLPWPLGKILYLKQVHVAKQILGVTKDNAERREEEIYRNANDAFSALSTRLGEQAYFFDNRPTSLDAVFLGHALFTLYALPENSMLRSKLLEHDNLVRYTEKHKLELVDSSASSSSGTQSQSDPSSVPRRPSQWSSKPKSKPKREKTEEEKKFRRRAKYFLVTQLIAVLVFLSLLGGSGDAEVELDEDDYE